MKFDINIKPCLELNEYEIDEYKKILDKDIPINNDSKLISTIIKVPVYCVFGTYEREPYFFNRIYSFIYTDGENVKLLNIYDRNDNNENIIVTNKEDSYAVIAIYEQPCISGRFVLTKECTKVLKLVYNADTKW